MQELPVGYAVHEKDFLSLKRRGKYKRKAHLMEAFWLHFDILKESIRMSKKDIWISLGVFVVAIMFIVLYVKLSFLIQALS